MKWRVDVRYPGEMYQSRNRTALFPEGNGGKRIVGPLEYVDKNSRLYMVHEEHEFPARDDAEEWYRKNAGVLKAGISQEHDGLPALMVLYCREDIEIGSERQ